MGDVFAIQAEITSAIVDRLKPKLLGQEKARLAKRQPVDIEAYNLYLKGLFFGNKRGETNLKKAIEHFELAIARDPNCALAYAGLASSYGLLPVYSPLPPKEVVLKAREMALKALEIDEMLAQARTSLGSIRTFYDWDWEGGEGEFKRAIELNPAFAGAHQAYSSNLMLRARFDAAIKEMEQALELDPLSVGINHDLGTVCICAGQFDRAVNALKRTLEMDPSRVYAHHNLGEAYFGKSMYEEALVEFQKERGISKGAQAWTELYIGGTYVEMGKPDEAQKVLNDLLERSKAEYVSPFILAGFHFVLGENDEGFKLLDKAYKEQDTWMCWLKIEPLLDSIRSDPKYTALLRKMNLDN
ncbi:MAG: tetratricopeptide repeat protein [Planctomycetota bacterium]|jgi:tetratricopeptide (TPR) repeat protein